MSHLDVPHLRMVDVTLPCYSTIAACSFHLFYVFACCSVLPLGFESLY